MLGSLQLAPACGGLARCLVWLALKQGAGHALACEPAQMAAAAAGRGMHVTLLLPRLEEASLAPSTALLSMRCPHALELGSTVYTQDGPTSCSWYTPVELPV